MLYVNLKHKGAVNEPLSMGAVPEIGSKIIHPKHGHIRVEDVVFEVNQERNEVSITVLTLVEEEYEAAQKK